MSKMALLIPYRDRAEHLDIFLKAFPLKMQALSPYIEYGIHIVEQAPEKPFNRGKLLNAGFTLAKESFDYFCFHDVDMIPVYADYSYPEIPTHLAADVDQFRDWKGRGLAYNTYFGGVVLFNKRNFMQVNGFSNDYWGYGGEDDDLALRVAQSGLKWTRRAGVFESLAHPYLGGKKDHQANKNLFTARSPDESSNQSGLSDLTFSLLKQEIYSTHTHYLISV
jgi:beta-1,4-galactosyltransferase 1